MRRARAVVIASLAVASSFSSGCGREGELAAQADGDRARIAIGAIARQIDVTIARKRSPPASLGELVDEGKLTAAQLQDPWGRPLRYATGTGRRFTLCSNGPDGAEGGGDDICHEP